MNLGSVAEHWQFSLGDYLQRTGGAPTVLKFYHSSGGLNNTGEWREIKLVAYYYSVLVVLLFSHVAPFLSLNGQVKISKCKIFDPTCMLLDLILVPFQSPAALAIYTRSQTVFISCVLLLFTPVDSDALRRRSLLPPPMKLSTDCKPLPGLGGHLLLSLHRRAPWNNLIACGIDRPNKTLRLQVYVTLDVPAES